METTTIQYESLTNDVLFHMVFTKNEKARRGLISCLLGIPVSEIKDVIVLNPMQYMDAIDSKLTILDLRVLFNNNTYINIEMQVRRFPFWCNRTVVYSCRQIVDQTNVDGFEYENLEPVILISIMDHTIFPDHKVFFNKYCLQDKTGYLYSDKLQFYVMDLTAISDATEEDIKQGLVQWANAFSAESWDDIDKIDNPDIKEAVNQMRTIMSSPEDREIVWRHKLAQLDYDTMMKGARNEGFSNGYSSGVEQNKLDNARTLKTSGLDPTFIANAIGLPLDVVNAL